MTFSRGPNLPRISNAPNSSVEWVRPLDAPPPGVPGPAVPGVPLGPQGIRERGVGPGSGRRRITRLVAKMKSNG